MSWFLLAIAAQVLATCAVLIDKAVISRHNPHPLTLLSMVGLSNLLLAVVLLLARGWPNVGLGYLVAALGSGVLLVSYLVPYFIALQRSDASAVGTLFQLSPLWTLLLAAIFLAERPDALQYVGFAIVLAGAISIELASGPFRPHFATIGLMAGASLLAAVGAVLAKHAYAGAGFWDATLFVSLGAVGGAAVAVALSPSRMEILRQLPSLPASVFGAIAMAEGLNLGFEVLYLRAISRGPSVALVSVTEGVQPALLVVGAALLSKSWPKVFDEKTDRRTLSKRLAGAVIVFAGLGMLQ
jgi:drug/metabolite transporter (DMT)-like permease